MDVEEALETKISGASNPNDELAHPEFLPSRSGWNLPGLARRSRIIHTEDGNTTVGSGKWHGDGDDNEAGSDISLLPLNDKDIHTEGIFLNLDRPHGGVPVAAEIMAGWARVIQDEAGTATVQRN